MKKLIGILGIGFVMILTSCAGSGHASCPAYGDDLDQKSIDLVTDNTEKV